jgi:Transposase DDE domain
MSRLKVSLRRRKRKKIEMLFAHLKRILRLERLRLRGPSGAQDEFLLAATVQNLRKLAKLSPLPPQCLPEHQQTHARMSPRTISNS